MRLQMNLNGCESRVRMVFYLFVKACLLVVLRPSYTRATAVERVVSRSWYTSNDGHHTLSLWHKRTSITPLCFHYSAIIEYKKGKQRLMKTFCLPRYIFLFCYLLYLETLLRLRHTFFFNLKGFCFSFFILLRFLCKGVAFPFKSFLLVPLFSVLLTSYHPNLHQQRGVRLVRMLSAFLQ